MCRFAAYLGRPVALDEVLFKPNNSLIKQSVHAKELAEHPLNGDGFGVGWYNLELSMEPALFTSVRPAWNDQNLRYIAPKIYSSCFLCHVRRATRGSVGEANCHPFHYQRFLFMHNGDVADFSKIKRLVRRGLVSDEIYSWIKGQTDSEHFSAMFLDNFIRLKANYRIEDFAKVFRVTLDQVNELRVQHGITEPALINFVVSDGKSLLAARYTSAEPETASTLYYMTGGSLSVQEGVCHMLPQEENRTGAVLVVSEKLDAHGVDWKTVPVNHLLLVNDDLSTSLEAI